MQFVFCDGKLNVCAESPVVVFPRAEASLEVLVAHLGRISLTNQRLQAVFLISSNIVWNYGCGYKFFNLFGYGSGLVPDSDITDLF